MAIQDFTTNRRRNQARENWSARTSPLDQEPARIKVVGVGNAGCKRVERMMRRAVPGMTFAMVNTKANGAEAGEAGVDVIRIGANNTRAWEAPGNHQAFPRAPSVTCRCRPGIRNGGYGRRDRHQRGLKRRAPSQRTGGFRCRSSHRSLQF